MPLKFFASSRGRPRLALFVINVLHRKYHHQHTGYKYNNKNIFLYKVQHYIPPLTVYAVNLQLISEENKNSINAVCIN